METSELIKTIRGRLGMSQEAFAAALHVAFSTVNRWENKRTTPNGMTWVFIADYCEKNGIEKELIDAIRDRGR
jgi:transcriptional regulator with XRE-family HTH domain